MTRIKKMMNGGIRGRITSGLPLIDDGDTDQLVTLL